MNHGLTSTGINVICVKWGSKYGPEYVNRLYTMVDRNLDTPFTFYCYTDDATGLIPEVNMINIPKDNDLEVWWNKLPLFKAGMFEGTCLYFDVDVVIQNNITPLLQYLDPTKLTKIKTYWKLHKPSYRHYDPIKPLYSFDTTNNSSVMLWVAGTMEHIWDHFNENPDYYVIRYAGIDRFIDHEGFAVNHFPRGLIYSRALGIDESRSGPVINNKEQVVLFYDPKYMICIFNTFGDKISLKYGIYTTKDAYKGFEKYWT